MTDPTKEKLRRVATEAVDENCSQFIIDCRIDVSARELLSLIEECDAKEKELADTRELTRWSSSGPVARVARVALDGSVVIHYRHTTGQRLASAADALSWINRTEATDG